jgi:hypothetical protein
MKVLSTHHLYELEPFEDKTKPGQRIQFIEKALDPGTGAFHTVNDGTTNEEVLEMLIHRLHGLGEKLPSRENSLAITKLQECLFWLNERTRGRTARGVEGTPKP